MCRVARDIAPPHVHLKNDGTANAASPSSPINMKTAVKGVTIQVSNTKIENKDALVTRTAQAFEIGPLVKETTSGKIHTATQLAPTPISDRYIRMPDRSYSIKIYSLKQAKENQSRIVTNPWQEVSMHQYLDTELMLTGGYFGKEASTGKRKREEREEDMHTEDFRANDHLLRLQEVCLVDHMMYLLFPLYTHTLYDMIEQHPEGRLSGMQAKEMFQQVVKGLSTMHSIGMVHRRLTLDSIVYQASTASYAIDDFSMAIHVFPDSKYTSPEQHRTRYPVVQSGPYNPPECYPTTTTPLTLTSSSSSPFAEDIWALGMLLFMVLMGTYPMDRAVSTDTYYQCISVEHGLVAWIDSMQEEIHLDEVARSAMGLIQSMLLANPAERPTIQAIAMHPWLASIAIPSSDSDSI